MKVAVLADNHANYLALEAVTHHLEAWAPDRVIVAGDVVNRGPEPLKCLQFIREKQEGSGWLTVRGNHEDYVIVHSKPESPTSGTQFEISRLAYWTYQQLGRDISDLETMPFSIEFPGPDGKLVCIAHASMSGMRAGIYPGISAEKLQRRIGNSPSVFCSGHTHVPFICRSDHTLVVNVGSAGLPFDGDYRPSYAQLTWEKGEWRTEIVRIEYDLQEQVRIFHQSGFLEQGGPLAQLVLIELEGARSQLYQWGARYENLVLAGHTSVQAAVNDYLDCFMKK